MLKNPALVLELPSDYPELIIGVIVDIEREEASPSEQQVDDGHNSIIYAKYLCRVWLDDCAKDRRFDESGFDSVEKWVESNYDHRLSEADTDKQGMTSVTAASEGFLAGQSLVRKTSFNQRWCIG